MFFDKIKELEEKEIVKLDNRIIELEDINSDLTKTNLSLLDSKDKARKELEAEYDIRIQKAEELLNKRLIDQSDLHHKELESLRRSQEEAITLIEARVSNEVENRTNEAMSEIKATNKELKLELKHTQEFMNLYKNKFEWGKVELGADEIKWMLLSANPNGQKILKTMTATV